MNPHHHSTLWLLESQLAPYVDAFTQHLIECRYASHTTDSYLACIAHFAHWSTQCDIDVHRIDEKVVQQFLDEHLPYCDCAKPAHRVRQDLRAALGHLFFVLLRTKAVIADPPIGMTPVDEELRHFNDFMNHVHGLAIRTRSQYLCIIHRLLFEQFVRKSPPFRAGI